MGLGSRQTDGNKKWDTAVLNCIGLCSLKVRYPIYPSRMDSPGSHNPVFLFVGVYAKECSIYFPPQAKFESEDYHGWRLASGVWRKSRY
jgi:hypothetical protein